MQIKMLRVLFFCLILVVVSFVADSQLNPIQASDNASVPLILLTNSSSEKTQILRIYYSNQAEIDALARSLDIWEVHPAEGYIVAAVSSATRQWLEVAGYRLDVDTEKTALLQAPTAALDPRFYYFDDNYVNPNGLYIVNFLQDTNTAYPNLTELIDIGDAWQTNYGGPARDMWVLRITNEDPAYGDILDKPVFFLMAEIHAREVATPELAIRYIRYMTSGFEGQGGYRLDPDVTWMVNHHVVYVLAMQNPDGHVVNEANSSADWRKNFNNLNGCPYQNQFGVNLNRNHSFLWGCCGGSSGDPCDEIYRGGSEGSEPETQAFQDYIMTIIPDQNGPNDNWTIAPASPITTTGFFISLHSYADDILWPWFLPGYPDAPNQNQMEDIASKIASIDTYYYPAGTIGYTVDGSANYWTYGKLGIPAFTLEVGPIYGSCSGFFPPFGCIDGIDDMPRDFWAENRPVFIYATKIARQPYMNAFGPDALNIVVTPALVFPSMPVDLTATIADHRYGGNPLTPITAAEYFIDAPGVDGTGIAMTPSDGNWGGTSEDVRAMVDTIDFQISQHYILVHGKNSQGMWGPFTAVFLTIGNPDYGLIVGPTSASQPGYPGWHSDYLLLIINLGNILDTVTIQARGVWTVIAPLLVRPVSPSGSAENTISVFVPVQAQPGDGDTNTDTTMVTFDSTLPGITPAVATFLTAANVLYGMKVMADPASQIANASGIPVTYTLLITNTGNITDSYDLYATSAWEVDYPPNTPALQMGTSIATQVVVHVPLGVPSGSSNITTVMVIPNLDPMQRHQVILTTNTFWYSMYLPFTSKR